MGTEDDFQLSIFFSPSLATAFYSFLALKSNLNGEGEKFSFFTLKKIVFQLFQHEMRTESLETHLERRKSYEERERCELLMAQSLFLVSPKTFSSQVETEGDAI